jgi:hypothetical protein
VTATDAARFEAMIAGMARADGALDQIVPRAA